MSDNWITVCNKTDLTPNTGVCALLGDSQVAIFWEGISNQLFAVSNFDPIGEANVLSRGMLGSIGEQIVVASPLYKQHFDLHSGRCLEEPEHSISTWPIREAEGKIQIQANL